MTAPCPYSVEELIQMVREGLASVRYAARELGWPVEDVQMAAWGELRQ